MADEKKELLNNLIKDSKLDPAERYEKTVSKIYEKLKPIWMVECRDAVWLLNDEYIREVAKIIYLDDKMGGNLDPTSLNNDDQNLLSWKQVQNSIERYNALNYSLVDSDTIKAILSSIIKDKDSRDADRLKAIEMYNELYSAENVEGITFIQDIGLKLSKKSDINKGDNKKDETK